MNRYFDIHAYFRKVGFAFRALENRNFRLYFFGASVSLMGTWIQNLAIGWMVYRLTDSAFYLGLVGFAGQIPALILTPLAGVFADRTNRFKVLVITQSIPMILAFILAILTFSGHITVNYLLIIVVINGIAIAFDTPFRHAFLLDMLGDKKLIPNAVALNSTLFNTARFIGPSLGGLLIALFGEAVCFLINGISFSGVIVALLMMRLPGFVRPVSRMSVFGELKEGLSYAWNFLPARYMISLAMVLSFFGLPFQSFLPVYAADILNGDSQLLGFLTGALGAGALSGALFLASQNSIRGLPTLIRNAALLFGVALLAFSMSHYAWLSLLLLFITGFGMIISFASTNTLLQSVVAEDRRGRVLALYSMSFLGFTPVGSLLLGLAAEYLSVPYTTLAASMICLLFALFYATKAKIVKQQIL
ncbi:MAG: MFS transporter [Bacteroidetes bacterium]|nr:MFS transporter [Bacteroidota bacterium]